MSYTAKDLRLTPIPSSVARDFVERHHYSGKTVNNSQLHLGVYLGSSLEGAMQFGPPLDRSKLMGLVEGSTRETLLELNRMVFTDRLPRNSESRALGVSMRLLRKHAPQVKWVVTFADGTQCGDGTIYRAAGFLLTGIRPSKNLARLPSGEVIHKMTLESGPNTPREILGGRSLFEVTGGRYDFKRVCEVLGAELLVGYQLRYIRFVDPTWRDRLTVEPMPFETIDQMGASMYRGVRRAELV